MRNALLLSASALVLLLASAPEARAYLTPEEVLGADGQTVTVSSAGARSSARGSVLHGAATSVQRQASSARSRHRLPPRSGSPWREVPVQEMNSSSVAVEALHGGAPLTPSGPVGPILLIVALIVGVGTLVRAVWMERRAR